MQLACNITSSCSEKTADASAVVRLGTSEKIAGASAVIRSGIPPWPGAAFIMGCWLGLQFGYEDILPYTDFSIRLPQHYLPNLPVILDSFIHNNSAMVRITFSVVLAPKSSGSTSKSRAPPPHAWYLVCMYTPTYMVSYGILMLLSHVLKPATSQVHSWVVSLMAVCTFEQ